MYFIRFNKDQHTELKASLTKFIDLVFLVERASMNRTNHGTSTVEVNFVYLFLEVHFWRYIYTRTRCFSRQCLTSHGFLRRKNIVAIHWIESRNLFWLILGTFSDPRQYCEHENERALRESCALHCCVAKIL